jgi:endoglucanase
MSDLLQLVQELCALPAPPGREEPVRAWLREAWGDRVEQLQVDPIGNVVARVGGSGRRLVVTAHMDEIAYVVKQITPEGFLMLDGMPGIRRDGPDRRHMVGQGALVIGREGVVAEGIFAAPSGHVVGSSAGLRERARIDWNDFFVDIGVDSDREAEELGIHVGAAVVFANAPRTIGSKLAGKAMDDRLLLAIMHLLLEKLDGRTLTRELWYLATVQEETGLHGAKGFRADVEFDEAIALDVGLVGDTPVVEAADFAGRLGAGPALVHKDAHVAYDQPLLWALVDAAESAGLPFQHAVYASYGSDGAALIDRGIPSVLLAVPTRYTHTAFEMVDPADVLASVDLLAAFLTG